MGRGCVWVTVVPACLPACTTALWASLTVWGRRSLHRLLLLQLQDNNICTLHCTHSAVACHACTPGRLILLAEERAHRPRAAGGGSRGPPKPRTLSDTDTTYFFDTHVTLYRYSDSTADKTVMQLCEGASRAGNPRPAGAARHGRGGGGGGGTQRRQRGISRECECVLVYRYTTEIGRHLIGQSAGSRS
jgi:hypothetical protein